MVLAMLYTMVTFQLQDLVSFVYDHPSCLLHLGVLGLLGALGQIIVFRIICSPSHHVLPSLISTRKILTTLINAAVFGHDLKSLQIFGTLISLWVVSMHLWDAAKQ
jgi:hypothetical protein